MAMENDRNNLSISDLVYDMYDGDINDLAPPLPPPRRLQMNQPSHPPRTNRLENLCRSPPMLEGAATRDQPRENRADRSEECKICYEATVDSVLYSCGHMCLCYECGLQQWKGRGGGLCPMCRNIIQDV